MSEPEKGKVVRRIILVVEDEFFIAMELESVLTRGGFEVLGPANSVHQALELLKSQRPDAAVLDVNLNGEKVTPVALLLRSWGVPFVLASASDPAELARHDVFAKVPNLGKPTDMTRLVEVVRSL
ncbi:MULTISPECIES: response regulator [Rhizobium]|uniref:DNA-binding response OmpR family regulator n=1 Tax=Rhizobium tropici TaxID=398 RepID=A0A6P1CCZ6_RHITR|nr:MULTISPECIES: response regulator [Rhizobium]AGB75358.1 response regulator receiver domain-containing protein [Rhizobium tropici CIAT 899]MBB4241735.1 DNA-binding response OmpR family regulator [Rhizobium tropici]MBB5593618.1 DNA-binding response OmpR family regulator [Rhizobium tropici]MBB6492060.1 DNA-binding response OmpR family regulator [Rhizobium tropici]NEV13425.1 response regulator [Rhizobium tropici]